MIDFIGAAGRIRDRTSGWNHSSARAQRVRGLAIAALQRGGRVAVAPAC